MSLINSSLNESLENLKVLRLYKFVIAFRVIPNEFRGWGSMRRTKCDQDQGNWTLRSGVRGQNESKIGTFGSETFLLWSILPSTSPKLWIVRIWWFMVYHGSSFSSPLTLLYPSTSSYRRLSGGILGSDSKLCVVHSLSSEVNQESLRSDRYFIQVYPWTAHNGGQMKSLCPSHSQLWGF